MLLFPHWAPDKMFLLRGLLGQWESKKAAVNYMRTVLLNKEDEKIYVIPIMTSPYFILRTVD